VAGTTGHRSGRRVFALRRPWRRWRPPCIPALPRTGADQRGGVGCRPGARRWAALVALAAHHRADIAPSGPVDAFPARGADRPSWAGRSRLPPAMPAPV